MASSYGVRYGDGDVFLDLSTDAYSCRYVAEKAPSAVNSSCWTHGTGPGHIAPLLGAEIVDERSSGFIPRVALGDLALFARVLIYGGAYFSGRPIRQLLARIDRGTIRRSRRKDSIEQIVEMFDFLSLFLPVKLACLSRSFVLLRYLQLNGFDADWTFGVRLFPFYAHCWLSLDGLPIGDRYELTQAFEPIYVHRRRAS